MLAIYLAPRDFCRLTEGAKTFVVPEKEALPNANDD